MLETFALDISNNQNVVPMWIVFCFPFISETVDIDRSPLKKVMNAIIKVLKTKPLFFNSFNQCDAELQPQKINFSVLS